MGLVISRKVGESFTVGNDVIVSICDMRAGKVRLRIVAPKHIAIVRSEIIERARKDITTEGPPCQP